MKLLITFLMLFSVSNAFSQTTSEAAAIPNTAPSNSSTDVSFWERIKKAPIGLSVTNELSAATESIKGVANEVSLGLSYKITKKNSLSFSTSSAVSDFNTPKVKTTYGGTSVSYSRSGLLTQEKYGVNMNAGLSFKAYDGGNADNSGRSIFTTGVSRTFNPIFSLSTSANWEERVRKKSDDTLTRRAFYLVINPTIQITEKLSTSPTVLVYDYIKGPQVTDKFYFRFAPSLDYTFTEKFSSSLYWDGYPMQSGDAQVFAPTWYTKGSVGLVLSYSVL